MDETRERPPPGDDTLGEDARRPALDAVTRLCAAIARPADSSGRELETTLGALSAYVDLRFPGRLSAAERDAVVHRCLVAFVAPRYAGAATQDRPRPEELLRSCEDGALDTMASRTAADRVPDEPDGPGADAVAGVFGAEVTPDDVVAALRAIARNGRLRQFQIITRFLDIADRSGGAPTLAHVVRELRDDLPGRPRVDEGEVQSALFDFCCRLPRRA